MASHESLWIAAAAAAPIIALANTATITDVIGVYFEKRSRIRSVYTVSIVVFFSSIGLILQGVVLYYSLYSLLDGTDPIYPQFAILLLVFGLGFLLLNIFSSIAVRSLYYSAANIRSADFERDT